MSSSFSFPSTFAFAFAFLPLKNDVHTQCAILLVSSWDVPRDSDDDDLLVCLGMRVTFGRGFPALSV